MPSGAEVRVATKLLGVTPFKETVPRNEGKRTYTVSKPGYVASDVAIAGDVDGTARVELRKRSRPLSSPDPHNENHGLNPFE